MPARRDYTPEELAARLERERELARIRQANWRARHRVTVTNKEGPHNGHPVTVTPPPPPTPPVPTVSRGSFRTPAVRGNPKVAAVIDGLRAAGLPSQLSKRDCASLKATALESAQVVEAFGAVFRGEWDNAWLRKNLSVENVVDRYAGYAASRTAPRIQTNGHYQQPITLQPNRAKTYRAPEDYTPDDLARSDAAREQVRELLPANLRGRWRR